MTEFGHNYNTTATSRKILKHLSKNITACIWVRTRDLEFNSQLQNIWSGYIDGPAGPNMSNIIGPVGPIVLTKMVLHKHKWSGSRNGKGQLYIELKLRHKLDTRHVILKNTHSIYVYGNDAKFSKRCR